MQGYKSHKEWLSGFVKLRQVIPNNHLLVRIHEHKETYLTFIYEITRKYYCNTKGRPFVDPVVFFRMQIIVPSGDYKKSLPSGEGKI
jgi:hypothetical protein